MAKAPKTAHPKKAAMLAALAKTGNVSAACIDARVGRRTHYEWMAQDPEYPKQVAEAMDEAVELLEKEARRRAEEGVEEPVYQGGKKVGTIRRYSDTLLIFLLKSARPERYRERNVVYNVNLSELTEDQLARLAGGEPLEAVMLAGAPAAQSAGPVN